MRVFDKDKTNELFEYDLNLGYLRYDVLITHREAVEGVEEEFHYEVIAEYPNGGKDVEKVIDKPGVCATPAFDEFEEIKVFIPYKAEELKKAAEQKRIEEIKPRLDALSQDIVQDAVGEIVPDIENRKSEFVRLHNELRVLMGLEAREIKQ